MKDIFYDILFEGQMAQHGKDAMAVYKRGIKEADQMKVHDWQMRFRESYMREATFYDDCLLLLVTFPEFLKLHDDYVVEHGSDGYERTVLWVYKWVIDNTKEFYQISLKQFEAFCEDFKKRCMAANYSLRSYYQHLFVVNLYVDKEKAAEAFANYQKCKRDSLSDCAACERKTEIDFELAFGNYDKAIGLAEPLFSGRMTCAEEPAATYGAFLRYYNEQIAQGNMEHSEEASEACKKVKNEISRKQIVKEYVGDVLLFHAMMEPAKALPYYKKYWSYYEENKNPLDKIHFAAGAVRFFNRLKDRKTYKMKLDSNHPFYNESGKYEVGQFITYYQKQAMELIAKMDKRNGTTYFADYWKKICG